MGQLSDNPETAVHCVAVRLTGRTNGSTRLLQWVTLPRMVWMRGMCKHQIKKTDSDPESLDNKISWLWLAYRSTPHAATDEMPSNLLMLQEPHVIHLLCFFPLEKVAGSVSRQSEVHSTWQRSTRYCTERRKCSWNRNLQSIVWVCEGNAGPGSHASGKVSQEFG